MAKWSLYKINFTVCLQYISSIQHNIHSAYSQGSLLFMTTIYTYIVNDFFISLTYDKTPIYAATLL